MWTVLIKISRLKESPERAITSVCKYLKDQVSEIIFESPFVTKDTVLYEKWKTHYTELTDVHHIKVTFVEKFTHDVALSTPIVLELSPLVQIKDTDKQLLKHMKNSTKKTDKYQRIAYDVKTNFTQVSFSLWYVFICIVFCIDWWRQFVASFTFHTGHHVRFTEVWTANGRRVSPPHKSPWISCCGYWAHGDRSSIKESFGKCVTGPSYEIQGSWYFLYWMNLRDGMSGNGWRLWYAMAFVFYGWIGIAWWGPFITALFSVFGFKPMWLNFALEPFSTIRIALMLVSTLVHGIILHANFRWYRSIYGLVVPLLFPLAIPLVLPWLIWYSKIAFAKKEYNDILAYEDVNLE
jgi:hypothetical protein